MEKDALSLSCQKQIKKVAELSSDDYHMDRPLFFACQSDKERFCPEVQSGERKVYKCLMMHKEEETMSPSVSNGVQFDIFTCNHFSYFHGFVYICKTLFLQNHNTSVKNTVNPPISAMALIQKHIDFLQRLFDAGAYSKTCQFFAALSQWWPLFKNMSLLQRLVDGGAYSKTCRFFAALSQWWPLFKNMSLLQCLVDGGAYSKTCRFFAALIRWWRLFKNMSMFCSAYSMVALIQKHVNFFSTYSMVALIQKHVNFLQRLFECGDYSKTCQFLQRLFDGGDYSKTCRFFAALIRWWRLFKNMSIFCSAYSMVALIQKHVNFLQRLFDGAAYFESLMKKKMK